MNLFSRQLIVAGILYVATSGIIVTAQEAQSGLKCNAVHADLEENLATVGCKPSHSSCFLGEVDGNHGLRGTTYFRGESGNDGPPTSPGFRSYTGLFEYTTDRGVLVMRETGVVNTTQGNPESGALTAFQKVIDANGELTGTTGHLFVSGFNIGGHVVTTVTGVLCTP
ncbi:MAG TPA: hypothetical protein VHJ77_18920 [Vicinamibacterales bacterium]|jgi:hypothetical protein|nr:hypothetical protein [Vicinamibacterales bacterium]